MLWARPPVTDTLCSSKVCCRTSRQTTMQVHSICRNTEFCFLCSFGVCNLSASKVCEFKQLRSMRLQAMDPDYLQACKKRINSLKYRVLNKIFLVLSDLRGWIRQIFTYIVICCLTLVIFQSECFCLLDLSLRI